MVQSRFYERWEVRLILSRDSDSSVVAFLLRCWCSGYLARWQLHVFQRPCGITTLCRTLGLDIVLVDIWRNPSAQDMLNRTGRPKLLKGHSLSQEPCRLSSAQSLPRSIVVLGSNIVLVSSRFRRARHSVEGPKPYLIIRPRPFFHPFCGTQALHVFRQRPLCYLVSPGHKLH
jgi:hypothetical protein